MCGNGSGDEKQRTQREAVGDVLDDLDPEELDARLGDEP